MEEKFIRLKKQLEKIRDSEAVELPLNSYVNVGLLLERKLGIPLNDFSVPDIDGIEIKVSRISSGLPITLFSCTCDGPDFFEIKRLAETYGTYDKQYKKAKVLFITLSAREFSSWGKKLKMKLHIDSARKKIFILVANANGKIIEKRAFWNFATLEDTLVRKLSYMCCCRYRIYYKNSKKICRFIEFDYLKYRGFNFFLQVLRTGLIQVNIKYGVHKFGNKKGSAYNHGTAFLIKNSALNDLFEHFDFEQKK